MVYVEIRMNIDLQNELKKLKINVEKGMENHGAEYEDKLRQFITGYDFMRLGQTVNHERWESAMMSIRRMSLQAEALGLECFQRQFTGLRQNIARKDISETKNILSLVIVKRIQIQDVLKRFS